jgi:hypothetical protein
MKRIEKESKSKRRERLIKGGISYSAQRSVGQHPVRAAAGHSPSSPTILHSMVKLAPSPSAKEKKKKMCIEYPAIPISPPHGNK